MLATTKAKRSAALAATKPAQAQASGPGAISRPSPPIRILLSDSEFEGLRLTKRQVERDPTFEVVGEGSSGSEVAELIFRLRPDLVVLDPQMFAADGFDALGRVASELAPALVFVATTAEYALKAFETNAVDYLLKPFAPGRLAAALYRAKNAILERRGLLFPDLVDMRVGIRKEEDRELIFLKSSSDIDVLRKREVEWIEADGDYVKFHVAGRSYMVRGTMAALEAQLDPRRFIRIHRSIVLNADHLRKVRMSFDEDYAVVLCDGTKLRVSKGYLGRLKTIIENGTPFRKKSPFSRPAGP